MFTWPNLGMVRFRGISGLFGLAMSILAQPRLAKIRPMARKTSPDMLSKYTKKARLGGIRKQSTLGHIVFPNVFLMVA